MQSVPQPTQHLLLTRSSISPPSCCSPVVSFDLFLSTLKRCVRNAVVVVVTKHNADMSASKYSVHLQDVGFHMCGSVRICTTPERLEEAKYQMQRHGWQKSPQRLIATEEVAQVHPLLNVDDVLGALYFPGGYLWHYNEKKESIILYRKPFLRFFSEDGYTDPYSLTQAFGVGARMYGAEVYMPAPVTGLNYRSDGRWDVHTAHGTIKAKRVVNAAGKDITRFHSVHNIAS